MPHATPTRWICPRCKRVFRRPGQRHACGTGSRARLLRGKPPELVTLYRALESTVKSFGRVEIVAGERYALLRTTRIFADLTFMRDALRLAIHLGRTARDPRFFKVVRGSPNRVTHVTKVRSTVELRAVTPYLREAYRFAVSEESA